MRYVLSIVMFAAIALFPVWLFAEGIINGLILGVSLAILAGLFALFIWLTKKMYKKIAD